MKMTELAEKLQKMDNDQIEEYLGNLQDSGQYEKLIFDGPYEDLFDFDPDDGTVSWICPEHGYCEADLMDLFMDEGAMLEQFLECGCGFGE